MKVTDYHSSHGLDGHIRLTQSGEMIHFRMGKHETALHVTGSAGGQSFEGYLRVRPVTTDRDFDVVLELVVPDGAVPAAAGAPALARAAEAPKAAAQVHAVKNRDVDGSPMSDDPGIREDLSFKPVARVDAPLVRTPDPTTADGSPMAAGDEIKDGPVIVPVDPVLSRAEKVALEAGTAAEPGAHPATVVPPLTPPAAPDAPAPDLFLGEEKVGGLDEAPPAEAVAPVAVAEVPKGKREERRGGRGRR